MRKELPDYLDLRLCDNMDLMKEYEDGWFDLGIVDPPYGGGQHFNFRFGVGDSVYVNRRPKPKYFKELFRLSKNRIIWGGNYFTKDLPENRCWISWSKNQPCGSFSGFELAWTSFDEVSKEIRLDSYGFNHADKRHFGTQTIHPTQKPVALYKWLLKNYAKPGDKILDTHLGSMSIAIAVHEMNEVEGMNLTLVGCELDEDYYRDGIKRVLRATSQTKLNLR